MVIDTFDEDNKFSTERDAYLRPLWKARMGEGGRFCIVQDKEQQVKGKDIVIKKKNGLTINIDTKHDTHKPKNFFLEEESHGKPGWTVNDDLETDVVLYFFWLSTEENNDYYFNGTYEFDFGKLKDWFQRYGTQYKDYYVEYSDTYGRIVPISRLIEELKIGENITPYVDSILKEGV